MRTLDVTEVTPSLVRLAFQVAASRGLKFPSPEFEEKVAEFIQGLKKIEAVERWIVEFQLVTSGTWRPSDDIRDIFSSREKAEEAIQLYKPDTHLCYRAARLEDTKR